MTKCEVCRERESVGVCCVPGVPYSAAYCAECLQANAHPYGILVANTSCAGNGLDDPNVAEWWKELVRITLKHLGKTEEEFNADVVEMNRKVAEDMKKRMESDECDESSSSPPF